MTKAGMQIHPIRTESDHERAVARIHELISAAPGAAAGDELDVLATLVDAYEARHHAIDSPDPVTAIQFRMEQQGLTRRDLEPMIGSRARVSEIMTRKRGLTLAMVRRVKRGLGISADLLIGDSSPGQATIPSPRTGRNTVPRPFANPKAIKRAREK